MKRYKITPSYIKIYYGCIVLFFCLIVLEGFYLRKNGFEIVDIVPLVIFISSLIVAVYSVLTDFQCGSFAVDSEGISMRIGMKTVRHSWSEFAAAGIIVVEAGSSKSFWVCFSKYRLTSEETREFLSKTRRDLDSIAFFQYRKNVLHAVLPDVPDLLAQELLAAEQLITAVSDA